MSPAKPTLTAQLEALSAANVSAKQRVREADLAHARAQADVERLRDELLDAYAAQDEARAAKASKERDKAESGALREAAERLEGARLAVAKAEAERGVFARENWRGLVGERMPDATAAAQAAEDAVEALGAAEAVWQRVAQEVASVLRLAGEDTGGMPAFPEELHRLGREAQRVGGVQVPPPVPGGSRMVERPLRFGESRKAA